MMLLFILVSCICSVCESCRLEDEYRAEKLKSVINSQSSCHVHFINKNKLRLEGEFLPPITIDTHRVKSISLPLMWVRPLNCVILLIAEFLEPTAEKTWFFDSIKTFHETFLSDDSSKTKSSRFSVLLFAGPSPRGKILYKIGNMRQTTLSFRLIAIVEFISSTNGRKSHVKNYIVHRFDPTSPLLKVEFRKLMSTIRELKDLAAYSGNFFSLYDTPKELAPFMSERNLRRKSGPAGTAKQIFSATHLSASLIKNVVDIYVLEEVWRNLNSSVTHKYKYNRNFERARISHMEVWIGRNTHEALFELLSSPHLPLKSISHSFLTCYHNPVLSYDFYYTPFQRDVWITFLVVTFLMWSFLKHLVFQKFGFESYSRFSAFMFVLSTLTDDSCGMPDKLRKNWNVRFLFGPWFLISVILVNCYIGLAISSLTAPIKLQSIHFFKNLTSMHYSHGEIIRDQLWAKAYDSFLETSFDSQLSLSGTDRNVSRRAFDSEREFFCVLFHNFELFALS